MFKDFLEEGDEDMRFIMLEDRDDRVLIEAICDMPFPPQNCFPKSLMTLAPEQDIKPKPHEPRLR